MRRGVPADEIFYSLSNVRPVSMKKPVVGRVEGFTISLEDATGMAVGERTLTGRVARRGYGRPIVNSSACALLVSKINAPNLSFQLGEDTSHGLCVTPNMGAGGRAAPIGPFPTINVALRGPKNHPDVPDDRGVGCEAIQHPPGQRAVVNRPVELFCHAAQHIESASSLSIHCGGVCPEGSVVATNPDAFRVVFSIIVLVGVVSGEKKWYLHCFTCLKIGHSSHGTVDCVSGRCRGIREGMAWRGKAATRCELDANLSPVSELSRKCYIPMQSRQSQRAKSGCGC